MAGLTLKVSRPPKAGRLDCPVRTDLHFFLPDSEVCSLHLALPFSTIFPFFYHIYGHSALFAAALFSSTF